MPKIQKKYVLWEDLEQLGLSGGVGGLSNYYTKTEINVFFEGEDSGKKQVHWDRVTNKPSTFTPSAHAASHEKGGSDLIDLLADLTVDKLTIGSFYLDTLIANNKVSDSDKWDGYQFADYLDQAVKQASSPSFVGITLSANNWLKTTGLNLIRDSYFGYSAGYRALQLGELGASKGIAIGINPTTIAGSAFFGNEIALPNVVEIMQANAGLTNWIQNVLIFNNGNIYPCQDSYYISNAFLVANNKVADSDKWDGYDLPALVAERVLATLDGSTLQWWQANLDWLSDVALNKWQTAAAYDVLTRDSDGDWCAQEIEAVVYKWPFKSVWEKTECLNASSNPPWNQGTISGGTINSVAGEDDHPGILRLSSGATSSGYYILMGTTSIKLQGKEQADFVFRTRGAVDFSLIYYRIGFHDSITISAPTDGAWLDLANSAVIYGKTANGGTTSTTATGYTVSVNTWYRGRIIVNSDATQIDFYIYSMDGTELWHQSLTTNIPASATGHGVLAYSNTGSGITQLFWLDYMDYIIARGLSRG